MSDIIGRIAHILAREGIPPGAWNRKLAEVIVKELDLEQEYDDHDGTMPPEVRWCTGWETTDVV